MWIKPKEFIKNKKFSISKNYFEYANVGSVIDIIDIIRDNKDNFNELICKNDLVKPYFDIESNKEFDINKIVNNIKGNFKWSYHVIIDGYHLIDKTQAKFIAIDLHDYHPEVDTSVYSDGYQNIRMLNCVKKGETVPFKLIGREYSDEIFGKCLITNIEEDSIYV